MALKSPEKVQDVGKHTAPPTGGAVVAPAAKDLSTTKGGRPEVAEPIPSKPQGEQANGTTHERRHSLGDDPAAMTIDFLRARLLSERSASKSAKQRAQLLAKRVLELEQRLEFEIGQRKKAEAAVREALSKLTQAGLIVDSTAFFSFGTEVATVEPEGKDQVQSHQSAAGKTPAGSSGQEQALQDGISDEGSGKRGISGDEDSVTQNTGKESNVVANGNNGDEEATSSDDGIQLAADVAEFQAQQKPIAWKGKKGDPECQEIPQAEAKKSPELLKSEWAVDTTPDGVDSPKRRNGRSLRRIQRRETRVVEERLKGMWDRLGEEMGTGRAEEDLDRSELLGWMDDVVNMLHKKPEENPLSSDGSGDSKLKRGQVVDTDVREGGPQSNGATVEGKKDVKDSFLDSSNKSFEKLIAEYEAEEKAQRLWEKKYHAKQLSADSSILNQDEQAGMSAPSDDTATISDLGAKLSSEGGTSADPVGFAEKNCVQASSATDSSLAPADPDPPSFQRDVAGSELDIAVSTSPRESEVVLMQTAEFPAPSSGSQAEPQALPLELNDSTAADSVRGAVASELLSSSAGHSAETPGDVQAPMAEVAMSEVQPPVVGAVGCETQTTVADVGSSEGQPIATDGADVVASSGIPRTASVHTNSFGATNEAIADPPLDRQNYVPSPVEEESSLGPGSEQHDVSGAALAASPELSSEVKIRQDLMPERLPRSPAHEAANGTCRTPYTATSVDYRDQWLGGGPRPMPPELDRRDVRGEWLRHRYAGDRVNASRSQAGFEDAMIEEELAYRRMESEYYAQERRRMAAHYSSRSPLPGADYNRELYEQPAFSRSRSITSRQLYRDLDADPFYDPERSQRSRSAGRGYPNERGYRMCDIEDRFPYHETTYGYDAAEHAYRTSFADAELDYERARLRQDHALQEPLTREQEYRNMQQYPAVSSSFESELQGRELEQRTSPHYPLDYASPQQISPTFDAETYADANLQEREASSGLQDQPTSLSFERALKREAPRLRKESVTKLSQPEYSTSSTHQQTPASNQPVTQRRGPERISRGLLGPAQPPLKNVQPERVSRGPPRVPAPGPQRRETSDRPIRQSVSKKVPSDRKSFVATKGAPGDQSQTYLALPSYAGEGEDSVESGKSQGEKPRSASDKQQVSRNAGPATTKVAARDGPRQAQVAKDGNSSGARPDDAKPILALPSYAGEGVGADPIDALNPRLDEELLADVSASTASQAKAVYQPATDAAYYRPPNDGQLQSQDMLEVPRFAGDGQYRSQKLRGSSAHSRGPQGMIQAIGEQEYRRGGRPQVGRHVHPHLALPSYAEEAASIHEREALRFKGAERYTESVNFEGRSLRDRLPAGSDPAAIQYAHLRERQQHHYQVPVDPYHGAQVIRENPSARHHAIPPVGSRGTPTMPLNPKEPSPSHNYTPPEDQASGGNLGDILKALRLAKDRIRGSAEAETHTRSLYDPREQGSHATSTGMLPPSRLFSTPDVADHREEMLRAALQNHSRADLMRHSTSDVNGPFVRLPRSSSVSSAGMDSPAGPLLLRDERSSLEGLSSTYVDKLNVGKGIQFFFP